MSKAKCIMVQGTMSGAGKSLLCAALCRIFAQDGYRVAPFKSQNMALNSFVTRDGLEMGRAQVVQAQAAGIEPDVRMNPILLKPSSDVGSQVIVNGEVRGQMPAAAYFKMKRALIPEILSAYNSLAETVDIIVIEGAGSPAEINLKADDIVNMGLARLVDAPVLLAGDIDRGGVFASAYGSIMLQTPEDRRRIKGIIVNKFRGDRRLFDDGVRVMEEVCGVPVLGVIPYFHDIQIEEEDSVELEQKNDRAAAGRVNVAVVKLLHLSNFTDFDRLERDGRVHLYYTDRADELQKADVIVLPGSKSTLDDLRELKRNGLAEAVVQAARSGKTVMGICGGYQMMGTEVADPGGVEGTPARLSGLGLLPVHTVIGREKVTRQVEFRFRGSGTLCRGYEIHMGRTVADEAGQSFVPLNRLADGTADGCYVHDRCMGTYIHGILDNPSVLDFLLAPYTEEVACGTTEDYADYKERQYDLLAAHVRRNLDMVKFYRILSSEEVE
mgnify:CR=1 FL=1